MHIIGAQYNDSLKVGGWACLRSLKNNLEGNKDTQDNAMASWKGALLRSSEKSLPILFIPFIVMLSFHSICCLNKKGVIKTVFDHLDDSLIIF